MIVDKKLDDKGSVAVLGRGRDFCLTRMKDSGVPMLPRSCYVCGFGPCRYGSEDAAETSVPPMSRERFEVISNRVARDDNGTYVPSEGWEAYSAAVRYYTNEEPLEPATVMPQLEDIPLFVRPEDAELHSDPEPFPHEAYQADQERSEEPVTVMVDTNRGDSAVDFGEFPLVEEAKESEEYHGILDGDSYIHDTAQQESEEDLQEQMRMLARDLKDGRVDAFGFVEGINEIRKKMDLPPVYGVPLAEEGEADAYKSELGFISAEDFPRVVREILQHMDRPEREALLAVLLTEEYGDLERAEWRIRSIRNKPEHDQILADYEERKKWLVGVVSNVRPQANDRTGQGFELAFEVATGQSGYFGWALRGADVVTALEDAGVYSFKDLEGKPCYYEPEGPGGPGTVSRFKKFWKVI